MASMELRISKSSEIPIRQQLAEQIVFLIATEKLKPGQALPSVRELARRLGIHHNTVSQAYQDLVSRTWLVRRRGRRLTVRGTEERARPAHAEDLDDLINATLRLARQRGYSLQALRDRVRERLLAQPPDHILVVEEEPGLRRLLQEEIRQAVGWPIEACSREDLAAHRSLAIGALVVAPQYAIPDVDPLLPKNRPATPIAFSAADEQVSLVRELREPSVIAVVSVSQVFLETARGLLAPAVGRHHVLSEFRLPLESPRFLRGADVVFCDSIALSQVKSPKCVPYRLVAADSLQYLSNATGVFARI